LLPWKNASALVQIVRAHTKSVAFVRTGRGASELSPYAEVGVTAGGAAAGSAAAQTASTAGKRAKNKKTSSVVDTGNESCSERSESEGDNDYIAYTALLPGAACSSSANEFIIKVAIPCWIQMATFDSAFWLFVRVERTVVGGTVMFYFFMNIRRPMMPTPNFFILRVVNS
jgi:hypothetical protein